MHRDGHAVDAQVGVRLVRQADGQPLHLIGFVQDISDQLVIQRERDEALATLASAITSWWTRTPSWRTQTSSSST